jgi:ribosomal protein L9
MATQAELTKWKAKEESKQHKKDLATSVFLQLIEAIKHTSVSITGKKSDQKGQLFAQVKEVDIADAIFNATHVSIDPKQIHIAQPIKSLGSHTVELQQGSQKTSITISVK